MRGVSRLPSVSGQWRDRASALPVGRPLWEGDPAVTFSRRTSLFKDPKDWKIAGKPLKRLDTVDKLTGKLVYGIEYQGTRNAESTNQGLPAWR